MTTLHQQLFSGRSAPVLFAMHGEDIVYLPAGGVQRTIRALIKRNPLGESGDLQQVLVQGLVFSVLDDGTAGIASAALNTGGDKVQLSLWTGQAATWLPITKRLIDSSAGLLKLQAGG